MANALSYNTIFDYNRKKFLTIFGILTQVTMTNALAYNTAALAAAVQVVL